METTYILLSGVGVRLIATIIGYCFIKNCAWVLVWHNVEVVCNLL